MTDLEKWQEFFSTYGLTGKVKTIDLKHDELFLEFTAYEGNVEGYSGFQAVAVFDNSTQRFLRFGVWE